MRTLLLWLSLLSGTILLAQAQTGPPWVENSRFFSGGNYCYFNTIQRVAPSSVWILWHRAGGMGVENYGIASTSNNGATWQSAVIGYTPPGYHTPKSGINYYSLWGISSQEAWAVALDEPSSTLSLLHTTTGITGFAPVTTGISAPQTVRFFSANTGIVLCSGAASIYRTSDKGQSWQPVTLNVSFDFSYVYSRTPMPISALLGQHFWVQTSDGRLAHTPDAGQSWVMSSLPAKLHCLAFRDAQHGLAVSEPAPNQAATLYRTTDGGLTWALMSPTGTWPNQALAAVPASPGTYLSSNMRESGSIGTAISYDEGQSWQQLSATYGVDGFAVDDTGQVWGGTNDSHYIYALQLGNGVALASTSSSAAPDALAYPNPTTGLLNLPAAGQFRQALVLDMAGRQCRTTRLGPTATTLDLSDLATGIYLLRLEGPTSPAQQRITLVQE